MMTDEFWIYSWGLVGIPGKNVNVPSKEFYQIFSFVMRQLGSNLKKLLWIIPYNNIYQILTLRFFGWLIDR